MDGSIQGIGRATALKFASEGCTVVATDVNLEKLKELEGTKGNIARAPGKTSFGSRSVGFYKKFRDL